MGNPLPETIQHWEGALKRQRVFEDFAQKVTSRKRRKTGACSPAGILALDSHSDSLVPSVCSEKLHFPPP